MNEEIKQIVFRVNGKPEPQGSTRPFQIKSGKMAGKIITTSSNRNLGEWRRLVADQAQKVAPDKLWECPIVMTLNFQLPKPKSLSKKKAAFHIKRPDIDKLARACLDALTNIIYVDDNQITTLVVIKEYGDKPGVNISIIEDEGRGVCETCTYKICDNCEGIK